MKKVGKVLLIIMIAIVAVGAGAFFYIRSKFPATGDTEITEGYYKKFRSDGELEMKYSQLGEYEVSYTEVSSDNVSIQKIRFWYPSELEKNERLYPTIMVVNASGTPAASYEPFFERLASWGFVVIGNEDGQTGTGETASITLDAVLNLKETVIAGRIDTDNMGIIGYSQGGAGALAALTEYENGKVYKTVFTGSAAYKFMAGNFGWNYDVTEINIPYFMTAGTGKSDDAGVKDITKEYAGVCPLESLIENYNSISADVMKIRARATGAEHEEMLMRTDGYMTAWMLYHLRGNEETGKAFCTENAEILHNANWQDITRSDDHIWMVYLAYAIAAETGDLSFLDEEIPYLNKDLVTPGEKATLWQHLLKGMEFTENHLGEHDLPLILFSDWNDHLGPFGRKGKGESIMVSQQYIYALRQLSEIAELRNDKELADIFNGRIQKQEKALEKYAWDGEWFLRGLDDDAKPVGSHTDEHVRIWLNAQSWMVISGACKDRQVQAMDSASRELDTGMGLLLNTPGYPGWPSKEAAMVNGLPAGYSENGGVFCQANCWAIMAEALLGRGDIAWKYYQQLIPNNVIKKIGVEKYHGEAYAYCSTLLGKDNPEFGRACVSQVTGTAAWMDVVSTQYLLGIRPTLKGLLIDPSIPSAWDGFKVEREYRGFKLKIEVHNPDHLQHGVREMIINDNKYSVDDKAYVREDMLRKGMNSISVIL